MTLRKVNEMIEATKTELREVRRYLVRKDGTREDITDCPWCGTRDDAICAGHLSFAASEGVRYEAALRTARGLKADARFPFFFAHASAVCMKCDGELRQLRNSGFAPMRGQYAGSCPQCLTHTYYDCAENGVELVMTNEKRGES